MPEPRTITVDLNDPAAFNRIKGVLAEIRADSAYVSDEEIAMRVLRGLRPPVDQLPPGLYVDEGSGDVWLRYNEGPGDWSRVGDAKTYSWAGVLDVAAASGDGPLVPLYRACELIPDFADKDALEELVLEAQQFRSDPRPTVTEIVRSVLTALCARAEKQGAIGDRDLADV